MRMHCSFPRLVAFAAILSPFAQADELGDAASHVIGVQGTFWGEFTTEDSQLWPMLLPRMLGIAATAWQHEMTLDGDSLTAIAGHYRPILEAFGA